MFACLRVVSSYLRVSDPSVRIGRFFWRVLIVGPPTRSRGRATALLRCALHGIHLSLRGQSIGRLGSEREIVAPVAHTTGRNRTRSAPTDSLCRQHRPPLTNSLRKRSDTNLCSDFSGSLAAVTFSTASRGGTSSRLLSRLRCTRIGRLKPELVIRLRRLDRSAKAGS